MYLLYYKLLFNAFGDVLQKLVHAVSESDFQENSTAKKSDLSP